MEGPLIAGTNGTCIRYAVMDSEQAPPGKTDTTDNTPVAVKLRSGIELGTMRWVLVLGIAAAVLAMVGAAIGIY